MRTITKVVIVVLSLMLFGINLGYAQEGVEYVCDDTYRFTADDPENWAWVRQSEEDMTYPSESGTEFTAEEGVVVWHEYSYEFVYGDTPCEAEGSALNQILEQALQHVQQMECVVFCDE